MKGMEIYRFSSFIFKLLARHEAESEKSQLHYIEINEKARREKLFNMQIITSNRTEWNNKPQKLRNPRRRARQ